MPEALPSALPLVAIASTPARRDCQGRAHTGVAGPGWFEPSWELQHGLEVKEDWLGEDLLHGWIEGFLRSQRAAACTVSPRASTAIA